MGPDFSPIRGAEGWQLSNPPVLGMAPLLASLALFMEAGPDRLREKSLALTGFLAERIEAACGDAVEITTPLAPRQRGCQLSLKLAGGAGHGRQVFERLGRAGIVCDWREPDIIRVAPVPLYNRFADAEHFAGVLAGAVE